MTERTIECPSCSLKSSVRAWNGRTSEVVEVLRGEAVEITPIDERFEGCFYRCPNDECQDEVVTDRLGNLRTQSENGDPVRPILTTVSEGC